MDEYTESCRYFLLALVTWLHQNVCSGQKIIQNKMETRSTFTFVTCHHARLVASTRTDTHLYHIFPFLSSSHCFRVTSNLPSFCHGIGVGFKSIRASAVAAFDCEQLCAWKRDKHLCIRSAYGAMQTHTRVTHVERTHADLSSAYYA